MGHTGRPASARRIRLGMVGGGEGAFIGAVHRIAARLDDHFDLVAGALSASSEKAARSALALGLDPSRSYDDFAEMARRESARPDGIEAVSIVTPNHMHGPAIRAFLDAGIHVICDKPLTTGLDEARDLADRVRRSGLVFVLTHNYSGHPLVRQARAMVRGGALGDIRLIQVEYAQDWLAERTEGSGNKQADWRTDPARSGAGGCIGDIGTHAFHLVDFVTGLDLVELCADLSTFVAGRQLDDHAQVLMRYAGGARGVLWASQIASGEENEIRLRVYGTKGGLDWSQSRADRLIWSPLGGVRQIITRNGAGADAANRDASRLPGGHPEGYLEAFANIYAEAATAIRAARDGLCLPLALSIPTVEDGVKGLAFIDMAVRSSRSGKWTS